MFKCIRLFIVILDRIHPHPQQLCLQFVFLGKWLVDVKVVWDCAVDSRVGFFLQYPSAGKEQNLPASHTGCM